MFDGRFWRESGPSVRRKSKRKWRLRIGPTSHGCVSRCALMLRRLGHTLVHAWELPRRESSDNATRSRHSNVCPGSIDRLRTGRCSPMPSVSDLAKLSSIASNKECGRCAEYHDKDVSRVPIKMHAFSRVHAHSCCQKRIMLHMHIFNFPT